MIVELDYKYFLGIDLAMLAGPVVAKGQPERAARLLGASEGDLQSLGAGLQPADQFEIDRYVVDVKNKLDALSFEKAWAEGRLMSLDEAVAYAYEQNVDS